ncbi:MAG: response regulator transcription factor [Deltaproteobacteria bacterium]|nr:MAG: response regulator transcription factor [Deltaproteobacteria bacterium]
MAKILIADDEVQLVNMIKERLQFEGFETLVAHEGIRATEMANKQNPDLVLLDLLMPVGTGQSVLQNLKSAPKTKNIPVIVMTAMKKPGLEQEMLDAGANDFVAKPFEIKDLLEKIRALLETNPIA